MIYLISLTPNYTPNILVSPYNDTLIRPRIFWGLKPEDIHQSGAQQRHAQYSVETTLTPSGTSQKKHANSSLTVVANLMTSGWLFIRRESGLMGVDPDLLA